VAVHECDGSIRLHEYRERGLGRWLAGLLVPVVLVAVFWAFTLWGFSTWVGGSGMVRLIALVAALFVVPIVLVVAVGAVRGRLAQGSWRRRRPAEPVGRRPSGYATTLCPHGIALQHAGELGRLVPWSDVADLRVFPSTSGGGAVVAARLRPMAEPTGLPAVARLVEDASVPDDPAWLWLGGVRDTAEAQEVTARVARWRETATR
jgi:hypothetical protein